MYFLCSFVKDVYIYVGLIWGLSLVPFVHLHILWPTTPIESSLVRPWQAVSSSLCARLQYCAALLGLYLFVETLAVDFHEVTGLEFCLRLH